jgi:hypothetical protein
VQVLSTTRRRVLAVAGAIGVITGAITGVLAVWPKPPATLSAHFEGVTATPEVSLEQYDARATPIVAPRSASAGLQPYRLAAYTTSSSTTTGAEEAEKGHTGSTPTTSIGTTSTSEESHSGESTSTRPNTTPTTKSTISTAATPTPPSRPSYRHVTSKGAKRRGGKIALGSSSEIYPREKPAAPTLQAVAAPPPAPSLHPVSGALVSEGSEVPHGSVAAVAALVAGKPAEPAPGVGPTPEASTQTTEGASTTATPTESAPPTPSATPARKEASAKATHIVLPSRCSSRTCGATQEIERALTYDPNPVKAAEAVAAIFNDSRAEVVGRNLYPLGAEVSYNVTLKGFAHSTATIVWSLVGKADKQPLARPWWRDIVVAHVTPTVNEESLEGSFWVPMPPEHGDYLVKLFLLDSNGVHHATSYSEPAFH